MQATALPNLAPNLGRTFIVYQSKYGHLNAFNVLADRSVFFEHLDAAHREKNRETSSLKHKPIAIKDNICTKDFKTTAASGILKDFTSPYDATVVKLIRESGAFPVGKTNMDEFGMGSHSIHSHHGPVKMQRYPGENSSAGGSSGGSAMAVASAQSWAALGTDTGGSVRLPAAYTGVVGFKPSYGLISRWGVIAYANSLDTVGILGRTVRDVEGIFDILNVHDPKDPTSLPPPSRIRLLATKALSESGPSSLKIGIPLDYNIATLHPTVREAWIRALRLLWEQGHTLHPVRLPATQHALSAYYVLAPAEASSNLAKYDGVRYGSRIEGIDGTPDSVLFAKTRGQGFGPEVQRRILLGAFSLSAQAIDNYFIQAQKVRRLVQKDFDTIFAKPNPLLDSIASQGDEEAEKDLSVPSTEKVDLLLCPTAPSPAPSMLDVTQEDPLKAYMNDVFTVPSSLAGLPSISVPVNVSPELHGTKKAIPDDNFVSSVGVQIIGQYGEDKLLLDLAGRLQSLLKPPQFYGGDDVTAWGESFLGKSTEFESKKFATKAAKLGVSIAEAQKIDAERRAKRLPILTDLLTRTRGKGHIDEMARLCKIKPEDYVKKFTQSRRALDAERNYSNKLIQQKQKAEQAGFGGRSYDELSSLLIDKVGIMRLQQAAALFSEPLRKYISRFAAENDPVIAERELFEATKLRKIRRIWVSS